MDAQYSDSGISCGNPSQYLIASCLILAKYKIDYLSTDTFNHRVEIILRDDERVGIKDLIVELLEKLLQL